MKDKRKWKEKEIEWEEKMELRNKMWGIGLRVEEEMDK